MYPRLRSLSLATATVLLSLTSPLLLIPPLGISVALAQTPTSQERKAELIRLNQTTTTNMKPPRGSIEVQPLPGARTNASSASGFSHPYYWAHFTLIGNEQ